MYFSFSLVKSSHVTVWSSFPIREWQVSGLTIHLSHPIIPVGLISSHYCELFATVIWCFSFPPTYSALFPLPWLPITPENLSPLFPSVTMSLLFRFPFVALNAFPLFPSCLMLTLFRKSVVPMVTLQYHRFQGKIRSEGSQHFYREKN